MKVFLIVLMIVLFNALLACFYLMIRNERVSVFRIAINIITYDFLINYLNSFENDEKFNQHKSEYECLNRACEHLRDKYTYEQMLFSFKLLRRDKWYTDDEVFFLKQYKGFLPDSKKIFDELKKC